MKISILKTLLILKKEGSYSRTAARLNMTQPAVSMQIKTLEKYFETELTYRQDGQIKLTPAGKIVYTKAQEIINSWQDARSEVRGIEGVKYGTLKIGSSTIPSVYLVPPYLARLTEQHPRIEVELIVGDSRHICEELVDDNIDLGVIGYKPANNQLKKVPVVTDELVLIVPRKHQFSGMGKVDTKMLLSENFILREKGSGTRKNMLQVLGKNNISIDDIKVKAVLGSTESVISAVEAGLGISFVSELAAEKAVKHERINRVELKGLSLKRTIYCIYHRSREHDPVLREFIKLI